MKFDVIVRCCITIIPIVFSLNIFAQATGDFQTRNATGNWSDFNSWNLYNGSTWVPASAGQIPTGASSVFIQSSQEIIIDNALAVCNNLNINNLAGGRILFSTFTSELNLKGNMTLTGTANCFGSWNAGAKIVFSGTGNQSMPDNLGTNSVLDHIEVNKSSGTLTSGNSFRFNRFTLSAGNFEVASGGEVRGNSAGAVININGGAWNQVNSTTKIYDASLGTTFPIGTVTIDGGIMNLATSNSAGGFRFSAINVINGGILTLGNFSGAFMVGSSIYVGETSRLNIGLSSINLPAGGTFDGLVNYNRNGIQTIAPAIYHYLRIDGTGDKTFDTGTTRIPENGTLEMAGVGPSPALALGSGIFEVSPVNSNLTYSSASSQIAGAIDWNTNFQNITIDNSAGVSMTPLNRIISGTLNLLNGTFNIGVLGSLTLDGAPVIRTNGFMTGTSTSDLTISGNTGGSVILPLSGNISLRNITVSDTRNMVMDGLNNISLNGLFNIDANASYDNGGESQITNGGGASIIISGTFINRDKDNFTGSKGAIPGISPILNPGCTIEYGRSGDQVITARNDYKNVIFSDSGSKIPASAFTPNGTLLITGNAIVDASGHNIGDGVPWVTNFSMDGGRLIVGTNGTQPMMNGDYNLTGGVIEFAGNGSQTIRPKNYQNIEITGQGVGNSTGNITLNPNGTFTLKSGSIFEINDNSITGTGGTQKVTVENGAIFRTGNNEGFNGFTPTLYNFSSIHSNITNIELETGSTVEYMRAGDQPITNSGGLVYQNLAIGGSGNKYAPVGTLIVQGNLLNSGSAIFIPNGGTVLLNAIGNQSFAGFTYNNLLLSNGIKSTEGNCIIIDSLKIGPASTLSIRASDAITLHSDAIKTARVARIEGSINYNGTGKFIIERYIPAKKAWRFLSVPANSSQTIKEAWQESAGNTSEDPNPGFGTQITSDRVTWNTDGFDLFSPAGPSMKTFNSENEQYVGISSTNSTFQPALGGYMTFVRGDRSANSVGSQVSATTLRTTGRLVSGDQPAIQLVYGKIVPINNPFASAFDLRKLSIKDNLFFYVWDPNRGGEFGFGAYQTLAWNGSDFDVIPGSGSYGATANFIESGQAFFASTLGENTSLIFGEEIKGSSTNSTIPFTPVGRIGQQLRTNLYVVNQDGSVILADGVLHQFADIYDNKTDGKDALKFQASGETIAIKNDSSLLSIERRNEITVKDTLLFHLAGLRKKSYRMELIASKLHEAGLSAYLEDLYLNTRTQLNLNGTTLVEFAIDDNYNSPGVNRFRIIFEGPSDPLPVYFSSISAHSRNNDILVEWKIKEENNISYFEIERSFDGLVFEKMDKIEAGNSLQYGYEWIDAHPAAGTWFYRIKSIDRQGKIKYSPVVSAKFFISGSGFTVYPNPIQNGIINLKFVNQPGGNYKIRLFNHLGQVVLIKTINHNEGIESEKIKCKSKPAFGYYILEIDSPEGIINSINLIF
jgi:hypothetical protein